MERTAERPSFASGQELWDWLYHGNPIADVVVGDLTPDQRATLVGILDGMVRERAGANGRAVVDTPVHIGIGAKPGHS